MAQSVKGMFLRNNSRLRYRYSPKKLQRSIPRSTEDSTWAGASMQMRTRVLVILPAHQVRVAEPIGCCFASHGMGGPHGPVPQQFAEVRQVRSEPKRSAMPFEGNIAAESSEKAAGPLCAEPHRAAKPRCLPHGASRMARCSYD